MGISSSNFIVIISRGGAAFIQFLVLLIYGAYLEPSEFGELSLLMIAIGLCYSMVDFGVANTIITSRINRENLKKLQSLNLVVSIILGVFLFFISEIFNSLKFSNFFADSIKYFGLLLLLYSLTIVTYSRLHKAQRLKVLAAIDFFPVFTFLITVPFFLKLDLGIYTFIVSMFIQILTRFILLKLMINAKIFFIPPVVDKAILRTLLKQYISNLVVYLTGRVDQLLVAALLSTSVLGFYSFAKQIISYPVSLMISVFTQISFPFFSRFRSNKNKIKSLYIKSILILLSLISLYYLILYVLPEEEIRKTIPLWDFRSITASLIFLFAFARIILDTLISLSIGVGLIGKILNINLLILIFYLIISAAIPFYGINTYLIGLCILSFSFSMFLYRYTFKTISSE
tara:strand:- start:104 stop:1303 length:1200 start_codon:yes stop_codon:yes gene_type:complete